MQNTLIKSLLLPFICVAALSACNKPGPAESVGKSIDQTTSDAGKKLSETADKVEKKASEESSKAAVALSDGEITTQVKAAIFAEPGLKTLQISVDTIGGVVTLNGTVDNNDASSKAKSLAAAVKGVKSVENHLSVKSAG